MKLNTNIGPGAVIKPDQPVTVILSLQGETYALRMIREDFLAVFAAPVEDHDIHAVKHTIVRAFIREDDVLFIYAVLAIQRMVELVAGASSNDTDDLGGLCSTN